MFVTLKKSEIIIYLILLSSLPSVAFADNDQWANIYLTTSPPVGTGIDSSETLQIESYYSVGIEYNWGLEQFFIGLGGQYSKTLLGAYQPDRVKFDLDSNYLYVVGGRRFSIGEISHLELAVSFGAGRSTFQRGGGEKLSLGHNNVMGIRGIWVTQTPRIHENASIFLGYQGNKDLIDDFQYENLEISAKPLTKRSQIIFGLRLGF